MQHVNESGLLLGGPFVGANERNTGLINVRRHVLTLWQRRWIILLTTAAAIALAVVYLALTPSQYSAVATVLIDPRQQQVVNANSVLPSIGTDSAAVTSQVSVLESRGLLERVFDEQDLAADPEFSRIGLIPRVLASVQGRSVEVSPDAAFEEFRRRLSVQRLGLTYVLEARFISADPVKAARLANAIVDQYLSGLTQDKSDANLTVTHQLDERIDTLRAELSLAELAVETFKVEHNLLSGGGGNTVLQSQIDQMTGQLSVAREQAREAQTRAEQARVALETASGAAGLDDLLISEVGAQLRSQYNQRAAEISSLQASMGPRHPSLVAAQAEFLSLESLIKEEAWRSSAQLDAAARLAEQNVAGAESELADLATLLGENNRAEVTLRQLERDAEVARNLLEEFMRRALETSELGTMQNSEAKILSAASEPRSAAWPKANLLLALAGALGLTLGCTGALTLGGTSIVPGAGGGPASTPPATQRRRAPSFAHAGLAWKSLGTFPPRATTSGVSSIADFVGEIRAGKRGLFVAGVSTLSSMDLRSEMTYGLARHFASRGVPTAVFDLHPAGSVISQQMGDMNITVMSALAGPLTFVPRARPGVPFVVVDDRPIGNPLTLPQLGILERAARDGGYEIVLVILPGHDTPRWSNAAAARLDAAVIIMRTEEVLSDQVGVLAERHTEINCPVAFMTLAAVPALVPVTGAGLGNRPQEAM